MFYRPNNISLKSFIKIFQNVNIILLIIFVCSVWPTKMLLAVPADPNNSFEIVQPDGNQKLILSVKGDEHYHWTETDDGYTVVKNADGWYQYAVLDKGKLIPSKRIAQNSNDRSSDDRNFLESIDRHLKGSVTDTRNIADLDKVLNLENVTERDGRASINALVLLIDYPDEANTYTTTDFDNLMNATGHDGYGCIREYFEEISYNNLTINGTVFGWYTASNNRAYYGDNNGIYRARELAGEAVDAAIAASVDFSPYDNDGDGYVDALFIVHAGPGAEQGYSGYPWSHAWALSYSRYANGVYVYGYSMEPELHYGGGFHQVHIGVYCHEFGHQLGLPDLYDTDYSSGGIGDWGLMSGGSWGNSGKTPVHMCAWCKAELGWITPTNITQNSPLMQLPQIETGQTAYRLWTSGTQGSEYFLIENRQKVDFDLFLPA